MARRKRLLLVGWDSADWKIIHPLLDAGLLPGVRALVEDGVSGNLATLEPQLSPMLWTSVATGKMAYHHGVAGFTEVDPASGRVVPVSAATRRCRTLWEILGGRGLRSHVVGWFATQGERGLDGKLVSNLFAHLGPVPPEARPDQWPPPPPGTYWPEDLGRELDALRVAPREIDAEVLRAFVPRAAEVDQSKDRRLHFLAEKLAEAYSVQSAATWLMENDPDWDFMAVYFRAIDEISHAFMPFHPPRMDGVPEREFGIYREVVNGCYRAHDMMLQRLVHLAGPDATVLLVSDHGFHSDHLRPRFTPRVPAGITVWHRPQGVIAARGPELARDRLIHGARLLDVAPTILHHFGLPIGGDMEGRVLLEAFREGRPVETVTSWEDPAAEPRHPRLPPEADDALLAQFVALGYIDEASVGPEAGRATERENRWNLARACLYGGKFEQALELLEACVAAAPARTDYAQLLARTQLQLGLADEAEATLRACLDGLGPSTPARLLLASVAAQRGRPAEALAELDEVRRTEPENPQLLRELAEVFLALRRWDEAEQAARRLLALDPGDTRAHLALARCLLHGGRPREAVEAALDAVGLQYGAPRAHFLLGAARARCGQFEAAETALANCLRLAPSHRPAARHLARVRRMLGRPGADDALAKARLRRAVETAESERTRERIRLAAAGRARLRAEQPPAGGTPGRPLELTVVSGLPRSGTSLMMQILHAAGVEILHDGKRAADEDNPEGYWEWEEIRSLRDRPEIVARAEGKAVKIVSALLPSLPPRHRYRIVFMRRPIGEIVASQARMLARRGERPAASADDLAAMQEAHLDRLLARLRKNPRVALLEVDYPELVRNPLPGLERLRGFLGTDFRADPAAVAGVVRPALHRNRSAATIPRA